EARRARFDVRGALQKAARLRRRPFGAGEEVLGDGYGNRQRCSHSLFSTGIRTSDRCSGRVFRGREAAQNTGTGNSGKGCAAGNGRKQGGGQRGPGRMASHNVNFANATLEGALGGLQLQNHAAGDDARVHEMVDLFAGNGREDFVAIEDAGDIGEVHEVVRIDELSTGRSHVIGIDVVELAVRAQPEARGNRG